MMQLHSARFRYISLATVLSDPNTVAKCRLLASASFKLHQSCRQLMRFTGFAITYTVHVYERKIEMEMRLKETAEKFQGRLQRFTPFPTASDRAAYEQLPQEVLLQLRQEGEKYLHYQYPSILGTDYMNFKRTGNRVAFEDVYFARRHALMALTLAECADGQGRYLDDIINGIFALCEESGWQLPPHNSYLRGEPQYILPDATRPVIDLFACETGALLAGVCYLLQAQLDEVSPFITKRIHHELNLRIITPYIQEHFWWMGKGNEPMCNWTPWCTQNVLFTAFLGDFSDAVRLQVFRKAAESCDYFLKDYGDDGCCDEGAQYYRHAGLCLFNAMDVLNEVSSGAFQALFEWDKIKNIASYIYNVHVDDKYYFNFADCSAIAGRAGVREYLFGKKTGQLGLSVFAAADFQATNGALYSGEIDQINLYYSLQAIFHYNEIMHIDVSQPCQHKDIFYPSVGLFLTRSTSLALAVKAGDNNDSHNHNDTGSFTLYKEGKPLFADIGVESYTAKTFSSRRYEIWTMQSGYHNLPTIDGLDQKDGAAYHADDVQTHFGDNLSSISMELITAYPMDKAPAMTTTQTSANQTNLQTYKRTVTLDKGADTVTLTDTTNASNVILNFITYEKPALSDSKLQIGTLGTATFTGAELLEIETLPITDKRLQKAWDHDLYRIRLRLTASCFTMKIH